MIDPYGKMQLSLKGRTEQFRLDDDSIGLIEVRGNYDQKTGQIDIGAISNNKNFVFDLNGFLAKPDSTGNREMNLDGNFKNMSISPLKKILAGVFTDIDGFATGNLKVAGTASNIKLLGKVELVNAKMKVAYTQVNYSIPTASITFGDGFMDFGTASFKDDLGNTGYITKARLGHQGLKKMYYDFAINTNRLLLLDTKAKDNSQFYGTMIGRANFTLRGPQENMYMDIEGEPVDSSTLTLPSSTGRESSDADFIVWKVYGKEMTPSRVGAETNLHVRLDITANNYANVKVIIDDLTGDAINANGHGNLEIRAGTNDDFTIVGRYDIDRGNYNFTFQSVLKKPFILLEGAGNYIQWTGNPFDANMNIKARYEAENVRFSDLNLTEAGYYTNENIRRYRGKIFVLAELTGKLMKPAIRFQIELPPGSELRNDQEAQFVLQRIQSDENELNKQVSFLLVFNSFGPLTNTSTGNLAPRFYESVVVNSISGFISNQISRELSRAFEKSLGIKVNFNAQLYSGTNFLAGSGNAYLIDRSEVTLSFAKSILDERLTFTFGSALDFGLSSEQVQAAKFQFLPDFTAEWKIRPDGRLLLTFFYRDSYNYIYSGRENRSGISISHRREFDSMGELFRRKKKKNVVPAPSSPVTPIKTDTLTTGTGGNQ